MALEKKKFFNFSEKNQVNKKLQNFRINFSNIRFSKTVPCSMKKDNLLNNKLSFDNDPIYKKLVNLFMRHGKKTKSEKILIRSLQQLNEEYSNKALYILYKAVLNSVVIAGVRTKIFQLKKKKGGSIKKRVKYSPRLLKTHTMLNLGIRSIMIATIRRPWHLSLENNLKNELIDCAKEVGSPVRFAHRSVKLAFETRHKLHYRWINKDKDYNPYVITTNKIKKKIKNNKLIIK